MQLLLADGRNRGSGRSCLLPRSRTSRWMLNRSQFGQSGTICVRMSSEIVLCIELRVIVSVTVAWTIQQCDFVFWSRFRSFVSTRSWFARLQVTLVGEIAASCPTAGVAEQEAGLCRSTLWLAGAEPCHPAFYAIREAHRVGSRGR